MDGIFPGWVKPGPGWAGAGTAGARAPDADGPSSTGRPSGRSGGRRRKDAARRSRSVSVGEERCRPPSPGRGTRPFPLWTDPGGRGGRWTGPRRCAPGAGCRCRSRFPEAAGPGRGDGPGCSTSGRGHHPRSLAPKPSGSLRRARPGKGSLRRLRVPVGPSSLEGGPCRRGQGRGRVSGGRGRTRADTG